MKIETFSRKLKVTAVLGFCLALLVLATPAGAATKRYVLPGTAVFPEGIAYQPSTGNFFVGSTTDGTILSANVADSEASVFLPGGGDGRTAATGMKVHDGHLYVSGAATGQMFVYDIASKRLLAKFADGKSPTFINDVTVTPNGSGYFTDSNQPLLYRVSPDGNGGFKYEEWIDFTGTALVYQSGFNLNGIASSDDGSYLIVVQSNTGKLFRISTATKAVSEINIGSETVAAGDGIYVVGNMLWVLRNQLALVVGFEMSSDFSSGRVVSAFTDPDFMYPTTFAPTGSNLLVVNSQFNNRGEGLTPVLPFTVVAVDIPGQSGVTPGMPRTGGESLPAVYLLPLLLLLLATLTVGGGAWLRRRA